MKNKKTVIIHEPRIKSGSVPGSLNDLRKILPLIYSDEEFYQRRLDPWSDKQCCQFFSSCFDGFGKISTIVLVDVGSVFESTSKMQEDYDKGTDEYKNCQETIEYLENLLKKKMMFLVIDGQHRIWAMSSLLKGKLAWAKGKGIYASLKAKTNDNVVFDSKLTGKKFAEFDKSMQKYLLDEIEFRLILIKKARMDDIRDITVWTNLGESWSAHEIRAITPGVQNIWVNQVLRDALTRKMFIEMVTDMSGKKYDIKKKGEHLVLYEWSGYVGKVLKGKPYEWSTAKQELDEMAEITGVKHMTATARKQAKRIVKLVTDLTHSTGKLVQVKRSFLDNLIIFLANTTIKSILNPLEDNKILSIENHKEFYNWFLKIEKECREFERYELDSNGKIRETDTGKKVENSESFNKKCTAKKTDDITIRSSRLLDKFERDREKLFGSGIISYVDTKTITKQDKDIVAVRDNFTTVDGEELDFEDIFGKNPNVHLDHGNARKGVDKGETDVNNLKLRDGTANIIKSNRTEAF